MNNPLPSSRLYRFGPYRLDATAGVLWRGDEVVPLTPKTLDVLRLLVESGGSLVTKAELIEKAWPDTFVEEANLSHHVYRIRDVLGEQPSGAPYVETLAKRGYRFAAAVTVDEAPALAMAGVAAANLLEPGEPHVEASAPPVSAAPPQRLTRRAVLAIAGATAAVIITVLAGLQLTTSTPPAIESIAVLPFAPLVAADHDEALELGMANALITRLTSVNDLYVRPTTAVQQYTGAARDPIAAGREQKVDAVVDGRIQRAADHLRVTVQLLRVSDGRPVWGETFDEQVSDIFTLQDAISARLATSLRLHLSPVPARALRPETTNLEAYKAYLHGVYYSSTFASGAFQKAVTALEQAIKLDPQFAAAWGALAYAHSELIFSDMSTSAADNVAKSRNYAERALALDDNIGPAHAALWNVRFYYDWDWRGAERETTRLLEIAPGAAAAHQLRAWELSLLGRFDEGMTEARIARQIDPLSWQISGAIMSNYLWAHRPEEAIAEARQMLEPRSDLGPAPGFISVGVGQAHLRQGRFDEGVALIEKADADPAIKLGMLGNAYGRAGRRADAERVIRKLLEVPAGYRVPDYSVASVYAGLGDADRAFEWLNRAFASRSPWMSWIKIDPVLDPVRADPRFAALMARVGLPE